MAAKSVAPKAECSIRNEDNFSLKVLPCRHEFCLNCLYQLSEQECQLGITCPYCRELHELSLDAIGALPTLYYGQLECSVCRKPEAAMESFWCPDCVQLMCRKCTINHQKRSPDHIPSEWITFQAVKDCASHSLKLTEAQIELEQESLPQEEEKQVIQDFCKSLEEQLFAKLQETKKKKSVRNEVPFHERVTELFGELNLVDVNSFPKSFSSDRLQQVAHQILAVASEDHKTVNQENYFQPLKRKILKGLQVQPAELAQSLLISGKMETIEVKESEAPASCVEKSEKVPDPELIFNQQGDLVCTDDFLSALKDQYTLPTKTPKFKRWMYKGNGSQLPRLLSIMDKNQKCTKSLYLFPSEAFLAINIALPNRLKMDRLNHLQIEGVWLTEQSGKNFSRCILSILNQAPQLSMFGILGQGLPVHWMKGIWNYLPPSIAQITLRKLPLTPSEVHIIATTNYGSVKANIIELGFCKNSWESLFQLLAKVVETKNRMGRMIVFTVALCDFANDAGVFKQFLHTALQFKGGLRLCFSYFRFRETHWIQLESSLREQGKFPKVHSYKFTGAKVQEIAFLNMDCDEGILKQVKTMCNAKEIKFCFK